MIRSREVRLKSRSVGVPAPENFETAAKAFLRRFVTGKMLVKLG